MKFGSLGQVSREAIFSLSAEVGPNFATPPVGRWTTDEITTTCREDTAMSDGLATEAKSVLGDDTISGLIHNARITLQHGRYGLQVSIFSVKKGQSLGWSSVGRRQKRDGSFGKMQ